MKESPGQEALLIFFYFNFVLFCAYLLFGTWCFFYQDDAMAWLEAKYTDRLSWERDFKGISLATVQNNLKLILSIAGTCALLASTVNFACVRYSMKISMAFETIHTIVQVQNLVVILIAFLIIYSGQIAANYYEVPRVEESEPEYLPQVLIFTGVAMILVAFLGFFASRVESKVGIMTYTVLCVILMANFMIFTVLLNFGSQVLQQNFEEKCLDIMPYFHKNFYESFGCINKYTQNTTDATYLTCDKDQIVSIWETNVGVLVSEQSDFYGCLNDKCCEAMISFVKGKFNFLAAFSIVAFFFILVAILTVQYMYRKIRRFQTQILSHRNDKYIFLLMIGFTVGLTVLSQISILQNPQGQPQPSKSKSKLPGDYWTMYDLHVDNTIGLGYLNEESWWNFERLSLFQIANTNCPECNDQYTVELRLQSTPHGGQFRVTEPHNIQSIVIDNSTGTAILRGSINDVNQTLSSLEFQPACILDHNNLLELNITFFQKRLLEEITTTEIKFNEPKKYRIDLNLNSGYQRLYRGKLIEENLNANGQPPYFKALTGLSDVRMKVSLPFCKSCPVQNITVDSNGIFEFNMTMLNQSIPYTMKIEATKTGFQPVNVDYFVGGYPITEKVEMGTFSFYQSDEKLHNVTGRIFDAFTNKTFAGDYQLTVYQGFGEYNRTSWIPYERLSFYGNGDYYTGFYELYDLQTGPYVAVAEADGYIKNFQRFYALPSPPFTKQMRSLPLVENLKKGELALVLTWGYSPRDLDIHVEFIATPTILCKCDYSMHQCGGVKYIADTSIGGDRGGDVIKFDYIGDFQYIVYVSLFKHRTSPKAQPNAAPELTLADSQAQLKVFAPYYTWPVFIFEVPAAAANPSYNYWTAFCFDGKSGLRNLTPINALTQGVPDVSTCQQIYGTPEFLLPEEEIEPTP